jgi:hypothetical protein
MFRAFDCDSITVPSCEAHNSAKAGQDQAIVSAFLIPLQNRIDAGKYVDKPLAPNILSAIQTAKSSFERVKRRAISSPLIDTHPAEQKVFPDTAYLASPIDIKTWMRQLTAALIYHGTQLFDPKIRWDEAVAWSDNWIGTDKHEPLKPHHILQELQKQERLRAQLESFDWSNGWSAHPRHYPKEIYNFQIHLKEGEIIFRHRFYSQYTWFVWFNASIETISRLRSKITL